MNRWVLVEQDEGNIVHVQDSGQVTVFFVDYDEAKQNPEYRNEKQQELAYANIPREHKQRIVDIFKGYGIADIHDDAVAYVQSLPEAPTFAEVRNELSALTAQVDGMTDGEGRLRAGTQIHGRLRALNQKTRNLPDGPTKTELQQKLHALTNRVLQEVFNVSPAEIKAIDAKYTS